ncbi:hypothetical protein OPQ81_008266 [Rhizoctonia solani]|nr:hypothetical protein OPQ81_008266 [Rhizoctonia solani]
MNRNLGHPCDRIELGECDVLDSNDGYGVRPCMIGSSESNILGGEQLLLFPSPPSSPYHTIDNSPIKPRRVPMFPPPASPSLFGISSSSPAHTCTDPVVNSVTRLIGSRSKHTPQIGALSPPYICYPSAEPLEDDPFLVHALKPTKDQLGLGCATEYGPEFINPLESTVLTRPDENLVINPINISSSSKRSRVLRKQADASGSRASRASRMKKLVSKPNVTYREDQMLGSKTLVLGRILNGEDRFTPSTQPGESGEIFQPIFTRGSFANPSTSASPLFPTPSLTSSLDTPSTASFLPTPAHTSLFPSPEITDSPTTMRPFPDHGRVTRSGLRTRYAAPTPPIERYLMGGSKPLEPVSNRRIDDESSSLVQARLSGISRKLYENQGNIQTGEREDGVVFEGAGYSIESFKDRSTDLPSASLDSLSTSAESEYSSTVILSPVAPAASSVADQAHPSASIEYLADEKSQPKRAREESDEDWTLLVTKRIKLVGKTNASVSPDKAGGSGQIDILHGDFGLGRGTRSQVRAVAALLAISSSEVSQNASENQAGHAKGENSQSEPAEIKTPFTRRASARLKGQWSPRNEVTTQTSRRSQRASNNIKHEVVGRAPSRAVKSPSNSIQKSRPTASAPIQAPKATVSKMDSSKVRAYNAKIKTENKDGPESQGADHVSGRQFWVTWLGTINSRSLDFEVHHQIPSELLPRPDSSVVFESDGKVIRRTFPKKLPIHEDYPKWYRRNPVSAYFMEEDPARKFVLGDEATYGKDAIPVAALIPNSALHFNLYTPRFMRGTGIKKFALCPICVEPVWRGGKGQNALFNTKISQYNYHMQYYHGICAQTGLPFSPPIAFRKTKRRKADVKQLEREVVEVGKCHVCKKWIPIESVKTSKIVASIPILQSLSVIDQDITSRWKHAASCHGTSRLAGDENPYIEDHVYLKLREYQALSGGNEAEELCSEGQASESHSFGASGGMGKEVSMSTENHELSMDSDSDLTDLEMEDVDVGMNTSH